MSDLISINIQPAISPAQSVHHSARSSTIHYLITPANTLTKYRHELKSINANGSIDEVGDYFKQRENEIKTDYKTSNKRAIQKNTQLYHEAVISFGRETFEQNEQQKILEKIDIFCSNFEQKYNVKILMVSLHLDEGHKVDEKINHNYHAHLLIENYSFETHKTGMRKVDYRQLQTDLANDFEELGFQRGNPELKAQRLEHRQYREQKENERTQLKRLEDELEPIVELNDKYFQAETVKEFSEKTATLIEEFKEQARAKELELEQLKKLYTQTREELKATKEATQKNYQELKQEYEEIKKELVKTVRTELVVAEKRGFNEYERMLEVKNSSIAKKSLLKVIEKPLKVYAVGELTSNIGQSINNLLEIKQKIEEKPVIKEVIIKQEKIIEVPKIVEKAVEKIIENPIIVDVDLNNSLRNELTVKTRENNFLKTTNQEHEKSINNLKQENESLKIENSTLKTAMVRFLDHEAVKGITNLGKSLLERFNEAFAVVKNVFNEKQELTKQNERLSKTNDIYLERYYQLIEEKQDLQKNMIKAETKIKEISTAREQEQKKQAIENDNDFDLSL